MPAEVELGIDELLPCGGAKLLEPGDLHLHERLERKVGQCRPAPKAERLAQELRAPVSVAAVRSLRDEALEAMQIDLFRLDVDDLAGVMRAHELRAEDLAELRDQVLERADRRLRRAPRPKLLDQTV